MLLYLHLKRALHNINMNGNTYANNLILFHFCLFRNLKWQVQRQTVAERKKTVF